MRDATMTSETARLGDFGAGGPRSDSQIDKQVAAREAATGELESPAAGTDPIGWHIPNSDATVLLEHPFGVDAYRSEYDPIVTSS